MNGVSLVEERLYESSQDAANGLFSAANEDAYDKIMNTYYDQGWVEGFQDEGERSMTNFARGLW